MAEFKAVSSSASSGWSASRCRRYRIRGAGWPPCSGLDYGDALGRAHFGRRAGRAQDAGSTWCADSPPLSSCSRVSGWQEPIQGRRRSGVQLGTSVPPSWAGVPGPSPSQLSPMRRGRVRPGPGEDAIDGGDARPAHPMMSCARRSQAFLRGCLSAAMGTRPLGWRPVPSQAYKPPCLRVSWVVQGRSASWHPVEEHALGRVLRTEVTPRPGSLQAPAASYLHMRSGICWVGSSGHALRRIPRSCSWLGSSTATCTVV